MRSLEKGKQLVTMTNYGAQYQVKFDMYIEAWISEVSSVLHIGNTDENRMPAVFLHPGTKQLQINVNNINKHIQGNMELGRWYTIEISKTSSATNVCIKKIVAIFLSFCRVLVMRSR